MSLAQDNIEKNTFDAKHELAQQTIYIQSISSQLSVIAERLNTIITLIRDKR